MRRLALLFATAAVGLAACDSADTIARLLRRQDAVDPPKLWLAQGVWPSGRVYRSTQVCADTALRDGFLRADPAVNGQACRPISERVEKPGLYAVRCTALSQEFGVTVTTSGDVKRDFTVRYALTPLDTGRGPFVQTVHYRLLGACPKGWRIGDQQGRMD